EGPGGAGRAAAGPEAVHAEGRVRVLRGDHRVRRAVRADAAGGADADADPVQLRLREDRRGRARAPGGAGPAADRVHARSEHRHRAGPGARDAAHGARAVQRAAGGARREGVVNAGRSPSAGSQVAVLRTGQEQETAGRALRDVMAQFATGMTVLTARGRLASGRTAEAFRS